MAMAAAYRLPLERFWIEFCTREISLIRITSQCTILPSIIFTSIRLFVFDIDNSFEEGVLK